MCLSACVFVWCLCGAALLYEVARRVAVFGGERRGGESVYRLCERAGCVLMIMRADNAREVCEAAKGNADGRSEGRASEVKENAMDWRAGWAEGAAPSSKALA